MKTLIIYLLNLICVAQLLAQDSQYEKAILKGKAMIATADSMSDFQQAANYFERVATNEPTEWLPLYYQAQATALAGNSVQGDLMEQHFDMALKLIDQAGLIDKNAEIIALKGFVQMMRLSSNPGKYGQSLSPIVFGLFQKALNLEPMNPRAILFLGQMEYGTSQFFGTSPEKGCNYIMKARDLFMNMTEEETILPSWGAGSADYSANRCNQ